MQNVRVINKEITYLKIILIVSLFATIGSLYYGYFGDPVTNFGTGDRFNRLNGFPACDMCRYIRVFQYPILLISAIALRKKDTHSWVYMLPLAVGGLFFATYKYLLEMNLIQESGLCAPWGVSCGTSPVTYRRFLTLSSMGIIAFILIIIFSIAIIRLHQKRIWSL